MNVFSINDGQCARTSGGVRVCASVDGTPTFFEISGDVPFDGLSGDPFVAPAMVHAMARRLPVRIARELPVSPTLLEGLATYQDIYRLAHPSLQAVAVSADASRRPIPPTGTTAAFFSGGVDGLHTLWRNRDRISHLLLCRGLDIPFTETARWERTLATARRTAAQFGKPLCTVETNVKQTLRSWEFDNQGAVLISAALAVPFDTLLVPASHDERTGFPYLIHPTTDVMLNTERTRVELDGVVRRTHKVQELVAAGVDLSMLRVCNRHTDFNCGTCEKCLRMMVTLEALGVSVAALPRLTDLSLIARMELWDDDFVTFWEDIAELTRECGRDDLTRVVERRVARFHRRDALRRADRALLGGRVSRWRGTLRELLGRSGRATR